MENGLTNTISDARRARRLTFEQASQELRDEAARTTVAERLAHMTELNRRAFSLAEEPARDPRAAFFVRGTR